MNGKTYYITTPIYYPSGKLHIGHSYTTVAADTMARYKRLQGYDVMFLTGTDEHGQKIERVAAENGVTPKQYVDVIAENFKSLWSLMKITNDRFIRTTDPGHVDSVQQIFKKLYDQGDIYKGEYEGWYCIPCESFWTGTQLKDGNCPDCGRHVERTREESYFFRLSKYQDRLVALFENDNEFLQPSFRRNEMLNNFLRPGLEDLCVSRTSFKWGIPVTFDDSHVVYVWVDALSNYITALGYLSGDDSAFRKYWPADVHLMAKEIVRFHALIWPAMLMALDLPLPRQVYGHGWLVLDGGKMSKSKGNVVDPVVLIDKYGLDAIRYFLLREVPFGADSVFSNEALIQRINADLANDLGNLVSRTSAMIGKYFGGTLPDILEPGEFDEELRTQLLALPGNMEKILDKLQFSTALAEIWKAVSRTNKYIDETVPWVLAKDESKRSRLASVMHHLAESIRIISILIEPFMPETPSKIWNIFHIPSSKTTWESAKVFSLQPWAAGIMASDPIFPRIDMKLELESLAAAAISSTADVKDDGPAKNIVTEPNASVGKNQKGAAEKISSPETISERIEGIAQIGIEDFSKVELRVVRVLTAERVEKADKLLKLTLDDGMDGRTVVSGIAKHYTPESLIGRALVLVANLKPARLRGIESQGMILAASDPAAGKLVLVTLDGDMPAGTRIS